MRLIDVDEAIINFGFEWDDIPPTREEFVRFLRKQPTADAVVVTRCKDCRYRGLICCPAIHETMGNRLVDYTVDNGYCWCGKPKED